MFMIVLSFIRAVLILSMNGEVVSNQDMLAFKIERENFHGDWNYTLHPRPPMVA